MKNLNNKQNIQIDYKSGRLLDAGITLKAYIFVSGIDPNTTDAKEVTAYGLQHATIITACDNSADVDEKKEAVKLVDGEIVNIEGQLYRTNFIGDFSDAIHFHEVDPAWDDLNLEDQVEMITRQTRALAYEMAHHSISDEDFKTQMTEIAELGEDVKEYMMEQHLDSL